MRFNRAHSVRSREDERYGLICHSKYTNPTATADTTTRCMNILPTIVIVVPAFGAGNQRSVYGYREMDFQATFFQIFEMRCAEAVDVAL